MQNNRVWTGMKSGQAASSRTEVNVLLCLKKPQRQFTSRAAFGIDQYQSWSPTDGLLVALLASGAQVR